MKLTQKLTKIALAVATLGASSAAFGVLPPAAQIGLSAGASAVRGNLTIALNNMCTAAGGHFGAVAAANANITTYGCASIPIGNVGGSGSGWGTATPAQWVNFQGTSFAVLMLNVDDGSFGAGRILNAVCYQHLNPAVGAAPGTLNTCPTLQTGTIVGGISDVEFTAFPPAVTTGLPVLEEAVGVGQTFGVAVSGPLYTAMFNHQRAAGGATVDKPIPNTCAVGDTGRLECIPTISKGQFAAIIDGNTFGSAKGAGAGFLAPGLGAAQLRYLRRVDTSGTQAAAQNYFLGLPCSTVQRGIIPEPTLPPVAPEILRHDDYSNLRVFAAPGTGDVRTELNRLTNPGTANPTYAIGVMSGENNQSAQNWRWLRVQGAAIGENAVPGTAGISNNATAINGQYDFFYEAFFFYKTVAQQSFWQTVSTSLKVIVPPTGLLRDIHLAGYNKGGSACQAVSTN